MTTIELNGHRTWASISKKRSPSVVLLHGGMSSSAGLLRYLGKPLSESYRIAAFDRRGHGRTADTDEPFHYSLMANEAIAFLEYLKRPAHLIGHSDGGVVALLVALQRPDLVKRVVVVGANYHFKGLHPVPEFELDGPAFDEWASDYAALSPDGIEHARVVVEKALTLFATEPTLNTKDLAMIASPVLVMAGDDDVVKLGHTCLMYESIPNAQLAIVPGTSHGLLKERPKESVRIIDHFLRSKLPPLTLAPLRRQVQPADQVGENPE